VAVLMPRGMGGSGAPGHRWGQGCHCVNAEEPEERCGCGSGAEEHRLGHGCGCVNAKGTIYKPGSAMCGAAAGRRGPDRPGCGCRQQGRGHAGVRLLATGGQGKQGRSCWPRGRKQAGVRLLATGGAGRQGCGSWPWRAPRRQGRKQEGCGCWPWGAQAGRCAAAGHGGRKPAGVRQLATRGARRQGCSCWPRGAQAGGGAAAGHGGRTPAGGAAAGHGGAGCWGHTRKR
jgi:hypothetical protein